LKFIIEKERPARIEMRDESLAAIDAGMKSSDLIRIQYSAKQASIANAWKKWIGQVEGLKNLDGVAVKQREEAEYRKMAESKPEWKKYSDALDSLNQYIKNNSNKEYRYAMGVEYFFYGPEFFKMIKASSELFNGWNTGVSAEVFSAEQKKLIASARAFFKNYNKGVDQSIFNALTLQYQGSEISANPNWSLINVAALSGDIYGKSIFTDSTRFIQFVTSYSNKSSKKLTNDPAFVFYNSYYPIFVQEVDKAFRQYQAKITPLMQRYVEGKYTMFPNDKHWPDANSTLRLTYGQLEGSSPVDGMAYTEHTTLDGMIAKNRTGNPDFELLPRMFELAANKTYGPYAQDGELWVCFTGSNHTTGGNSGSPVLDEKGNLMGLNFDRSWESTMSDYLFDPNRCRNIVVDIRYVLWVMDIYSGATHLVNEMTLIKD
jgi:hypothetical protein